MNKNTCFEIIVNMDCNAVCSFCSQNHIGRNFRTNLSKVEVYKNIIKAYNEGYEMLGFTGGEPLINKNILKYILFAKKIGFKYIRIQTNGIALNDEKLVSKLIDNGVTYFKISLHSHIKEIHDNLVGIVGAYDKIMDGINIIKQKGARIGINIVLTRKNFKYLGEFSLFLIEKGITNLVIIYPIIENMMFKNINKLSIKYIDCVSYIKISYEIFKNNGIKTPLILNFPMCLAKGFEDGVVNDFNGTIVLDSNGLLSNIDNKKGDGKIRIKQCHDCNFNNKCLGIDKNYFNKFGSNEFDNKITNNKIDFDFSLIKSVNYLSDDENCFLEILKIKNIVSIEEIKILKNDILICKDCDSINKIISIGEILINKNLIKKVLQEGKIYYLKC